LNSLLRTPLYDLHRELGATMVPFAGYEMPVRYPAGILAEHLGTREAAGLFDVSHMGQAWISGPRAPALLESLTTADVAGLGEGRQRYTLFTNEQGGIDDDLMVANAGDLYVVVVNAACKTADFARLHGAAGAGARVSAIDDHALLALQGPKAESALEPLVPGIGRLAFMGARRFAWNGAGLFVTRSGYTGEDGFEISVPAGHAMRLARALLDRPEVKPVGLGARDSLRLEAGLCLYGQDIDANTTPVEAGLEWAIARRRRAEGGFPGADRILRELAQGPARRRVGIRPDGRAPARAHTEIRDSNGRPVGEVTSGGFGPSVDGPVAMGYVASGTATPGTAVQLIVRDKALPARVHSLPFVPHRYRKS
jgi:aminomethyltransferase